MGVGHDGIEKREERAGRTMAGPTDLDSGCAQRIELLIEVLDAAQAAFRGTSAAMREQALADGLSTIGTLYGTLDLARSPEASVHLAAVYDASLRALGDGYGGDLDALTSAIAMARAIRSALRASAGSPPAAQPSRPSRAPRIRRAA